MVKIHSTQKMSSSGTILVEKGNTTPSVFPPEIFVSEVVAVSTATSHPSHSRRAEHAEGPSDHMLLTIDSTRVIK